MPQLNIKNATANTPPEILIYDVIGPDAYGYISAKLIAQTLKDIGQAERITVRLNSPGGDVFNGVAIYNLLKSHAAKITVQVDGLAASIASIIAMAGDTIAMAGNAMMMIHDPWTFTWGNAQDLQKTVDLLGQIKSSVLLPTYADRAGSKSSADQLSALMSAETWLSAEEAVAAGLADQVSANKQVSAYINPQIFAYKTIPEQFAQHPEPPQPDAAVPDPATRRNHAARRLAIASRLNAD